MDLVEIPVRMPGRGRPAGGERRGEVGHLGILRQPVGDVDAEAVDATVEPEAQDRLELLADLVVQPVEIRLLDVEQVQVPLAWRPVGLGDAGPRRTAERALPVVRRLPAARAASVAEHVPGPLPAARAGRQRLLEPLVLIGGVVGDDVHDHPQAEGVGVGEQAVHVGERAEARIDVPVVGDVVAGICLGRRVARVQPDGVDAQAAEVGEARADPGQIAEPVAVGVGEAAYIDLVDHGFPPPRDAGRLSVHRRHRSRRRRPPTSGAARRRPRGRDGAACRAWRRPTRPAAEP